jgi:hypothetical protein
MKNWSYTIIYFGFCCNACCCTFNSSFPFASLIDSTTLFEIERKAPIATSGDNNVYVTWWTNKSGNDKVMFKSSSDGGKTFSNKMNLSNIPKSDSQDAEIGASGNNVYVTWSERNQTMNEPVMRISNDNGKSFGQEVMLSAK